MDWMVVYIFYAMGWVGMSGDTGWGQYGGMGKVGIGMGTVGMRNPTL